MSVEGLIETWKDTRSGLIDEVQQIPAEQFTFKASAETRSVAQLLQHVIESQKMLIGETCQPDTNLMRRPFPEQIKHYAPGVSDVTDKDGLIELLSASIEEGAQKLAATGDQLNNMMTRFDGRQVPKIDFLNFAVSHEMYHRGQLTVYLRLLDIEPALTTRLKKLFGEPGEAASAAKS